MSFYMRYELSRLIREGEAKTFAGVQRDTGRAIFLHMVASTDTQSPELADLIRRAEIAGAILESGEFAGLRYLITEPIEPFPGLVSWLRSLAGSAPVKNAPVRAGVPSAPRSPAPAAPPQPGIVAKGPGEFTALFSNGEALVPRGPATPPSPGEFTALFGDKKPAEPASPAPQSKSAGEFTTMFGAAQALAPPAAPPAPSVASETAPSPPRARRTPAETETDEFDRIFNRATPEPAPQETERIAADNEPFWPDFASARPPKDTPDVEGQFTRFFGNAIPGEQIDIAAEQARNAGVKDEAAPFQAAGDFTRVFGPKTGANVPPPPPPPHRPDKLSVSQLFSPDASFIPRDSGETAPQQKTVETPAAAEPGEYTRMFAPGEDVTSAPAAPSPSSPSAPARAAAPPSQAMPAIMTAQKRSKRVLRTILIVLATAAGAGAFFMIVYLIMQRFTTSH